MKKASSKKATPERRKTPRSSSKGQSKAKGGVSKRASSPSTQTQAQDHCYHCNQRIKPDERALFVEEEVGRIFCDESCIASFFTPEIERLEKDYHRRRGASDFSAEERESLAHLRWITLQESDEVWREKTLTGDYRYTLISEFQPSSKKLWYICICLFLRGEPSFLYVSFPTKNEALVNHYRKGERVEIVRTPQGSQASQASRAYSSVEDTVPEGPSDGLADGWTEDETFRAQLNQERSAEDIPPSDFALYQSCLEETLEEPDEVWSYQPGGDDAPKLYHFIRYYDDEKPGVWYVIAARETDDEEEIEILDAFPTRDALLVDRYRQGEQEVGRQETRPSTQRIIH